MCSGPTSAATLLPAASSGASSSRTQLTSTRRAFTLSAWRHAADHRLRCYTCNHCAWPPEHAVLLVQQLHCVYDTAALLQRIFGQHISSAQTQHGLPQLMYINGLADAIASDKYGGHIFEMTRVADQDGKVVRTAVAVPSSCKPPSASMLIIVATPVI